MFNTLETTWDQSVRRGWSALASFGFEALALSLLLLVPMFTIQKPSAWVSMLQRPVELPTLPVSPPEQIVRGPVRVGSISNEQGHILIAPPNIPIHPQYINDATDGPIAPPDWKNVVVRPGGGGGDTAFYNLGGRIPVVIPDHAATKPLPVSHWAEGNLVYRVAPVYSKIAIQARIQGSVKLRAIISKTGTIEDLNALSGPPMLIQSAIDAVRQWRYRPYMLNGEPIAVDTEITVNFILDGSQ